MNNHEVPLYMNGKAIGRISVNRETGAFTGAFEPDLMPILTEAMDTNVKSVTFESLYGLFAHTKLNPQQRLAAYLEHDQKLEELDGKHCSRIDPHHGHVWYSEMGKGPAYYCQGNVVDDDVSFYTIRQADGDLRVLRRNVYGLRNAEAEGKRFHELTGGTITWEKQSFYLTDTTGT